MMEISLIDGLKVELLAMIQLFSQGKIKDERPPYERRTSCRRSDRRNQTHRRVSKSSPIKNDDLNRRADDRRNIYAERRRSDRRALERIKKI